MVGTIKKWLGIKGLERETLLCAQALLASRERLEAVERDVQSIRELVAKMGTDVAALLLSHKRSLTPEPAKPKIVAVPQRLNWKQFRSAAERASEPEREEA